MKIVLYSTIIMKDRIKSAGRSYSGSFSEESEKWN